MLDFGQSVRLTDIFIPTCPDLSSLVIDIWVDSEEKDLSRVTVSTDIGSKPLLLTGLLPPVKCRYLKVSVFFDLILKGKCFLSSSEIIHKSKIKLRVIQKVVNS